ncbi:hypothetical protein KIN20_023422 [Parelaphostrongylus tenuis]|uniref:Sphingomyelin phosphodiesterase n=1 Tax=Parelaphostrongylus tenuis TaxID=148309 RepID=A0AAD5QVD6_PARTN|nr:hypothetical protein KIN20_023422 [Parelaphostrongylus tenuis]
MEKLFVLLSALFFIGANVSLTRQQPSSHQPEHINKSDPGFSPVCASCTAMISAINVVLRWYRSEDVVLEFATLICKLIAKQPWNVCNGISGQFRDEFFYVFRRLSEESPSRICGLLLDSCADPNDVTQSGWTISLPPKLNSELMTKLRKKKTELVHSNIYSPPRNLRVLQLTDLHTDFDYNPSSEADCNSPVCCRERAGNPSISAGYWGTIGKCDIPYWTVKNMLEHINASYKIDYIMLSGDFVNHVDWSYSVEGHVKALRNISSLMRHYFPNTPTYWSIGNHEGVPVNSFAPHFVDERFWPSWLYKEFSAMSAPWIDSEAAETVLYRGSYSVKVVNGLRLISLNSGFCETTNFFLYLNQSDPDGTMSWLVLELFKAELSGESVHILSHIPPGDSECLEGWARNYYRIVQRFSNTITGQFFGHAHTDFFTVFYEDMHNISSKPIGVLYAAPSTTTFSGLNPAFRIYEVNVTDHFKIENIFNYFADLEKASVGNPPKWKLLYSAIDEYNLNDLSPTSWNNLVNSLQHDVRTAERFFRNAVRAGKNHMCDTTCQRTLLCALRMGHHNSTLYCPSERFSNITLE